MALSTPSDGRTRILVVDEHNTVTDEDVVFKSYPFTDKGVAGYLYPPPQTGPLLNLNEGADPALIAYFTSVEVDEGKELHVTAELDVGSDTESGRLRHQTISTPNPPF